MSLIFYTGSNYFWELHAIVYTQDKTGWHMTATIIWFDLMGVSPAIKSYLWFVMYDIYLYIWVRAPESWLPVFYGLNLTIPNAKISRLRLINIISTYSSRKNVLFKYQYA